MRCTLAGLGLTSFLLAACGIYIGQTEQSFHKHLWEQMFRPTLFRFHAAIIRTQLQG